MNTTDLDRLGDEIAELSVHLEAATARLLDLIREFDKMIVSASVQPSTGKQ